MAVALGRGIHVQVGVPVRVAFGVGGSNVEPVAEVAELRVSDVEVEVEVDEGIGRSVLGDRELAAGQLVEAAEDLLPDTAQVRPELVEQALLFLLGCLDPLVGDERVLPVAATRVVSGSCKTSRLKWGQHSTEVAFLLLTQQPRV